MRPPVDLQDVVVEVLDAEREASDAEFADGAELVVGEGPGFALKGDFNRLVPGQQTLHSLGQVAKLIG